MRTSAAVPALGPVPSQEPAQEPTEGFLVVIDGRERRFETKAEADKAVADWKRFLKHHRNIELMRRWEAQNNWRHR